MTRMIVLALVASLPVAACASVQPDPRATATNRVAPSEAAFSSPAPSAGWMEPAAYAFVFDSECGERATLGRFRVHVAGGRPIGFEPIDATARQFRGPPDMMPTLARIVTSVTDARARGAARAELTTDPTDGHPVSVMIDPEVNTIDDEECYTITEYAPQTGP
jgi:hypothetical protein